MRSNTAQETHAGCPTSLQQNLTACPCPRRLIESQQELQSQLTENSMVKEELADLKEGEPIFKLSGKVLVLQDPAEAKLLNNSRLEFINNQM